MRASKQTLIMLSLSVCSGCGPPPIDSLPPPLLDSLSVVTRISLPPAVTISAAVGTVDCAILLVGREWGEISKLKPDGSVVPLTGRVPGSLPRVQVGSGDGKSFPVWTHDPPLLGVLDAGTLAVDATELPQHPWGGTWSGVAAISAAGRIVVAPLSGNRPRELPEPWRSAPLFYYLDDDTDAPLAGGTIGPPDGQFLTWLKARSVLRANRDTVWVVNLLSGQVSAHIRTADQFEVDSASSYLLPQYFKTLEPREEVWTVPWIDIDGALPRFFAVPQVAGAVFGADGYLYATRNYDARWRRARVRRYATQGFWEVSHSGLEVYDSRGNLSGSFALPGVGARLSSVDPHGRMFFLVDDGVLVATTNRPVECPTVPPVIHPPIHDTPSASEPRLAPTGN